MLPKPVCWSTSWRTIRLL